jgi:purine nucleoside phosphorylase
MFRGLVKAALLSLPSAPVVVDAGAYVCIEGPAFSTKAESSIEAARDR